ncbi:MAG: hypothetical protein ACL93V_02070 [Candidatus Electrothrix sp. YB6]
MVRYRRLRAVLTGLCCILLLPAPGTAEDTAKKQQHPPYIRLALTEPVTSLDPADKDCDREIIPLLFAGLTEINTNAGVNENC